MKIAVLVVGSHHAGKSITINKWLKPMFYIEWECSKFILNSKNGRVWSQSLEESKRSIDSLIHFCIKYELIVIPCRPSNENPSSLIEIKKRLEKEDFIVYQVQVVKPSGELYYKNKANEIFNQLLSK
jgi:hypothetical protein